MDAQFEAADQAAQALEAELADFQVARAQVEAPPASSPAPPRLAPASRAPPHAPRRAPRARPQAVWDAPVALKLKQGQVEVPEAAVVTDFAGAALVARGSVVKLNEQIRGLGGEKVGVLKEVRDFRRGIAQLLWDNERLGMAADDLVELAREFQLLRVTKELQKALRGGADDSHGVELAQLERRLDAMGAAHAKTVAEREQQLAKLRRLKAEKEAELARMHGQIEVRARRAERAHSRDASAQRPRGARASRCRACAGC